MCYENLAVLDKPILDKILEATLGTTDLSDDLPRRHVVVAGQIDPRTYSEA
jgi:hypothetical protein